MNLALPKTLIIRDRKWLDHLHDEPCILTGIRGTEFDGVDPLHIGTFAKGMKSSDDECLPVLHRLHAHVGHQKGEMTMFRNNMPDWLLRECLRLYARKMYAEWKRSQPDAPARSIPRPLSPTKGRKS